MEITEILRKCDHTLLKQDATEAAVEKLCREAIEHSTASVCISPCFVSEMHRKFPELNICTVIGFPNGAATTASKVFEAEDAVKNGANEIDMVINISNVKDGKFTEILDEINAVKAACGGHILKVIIETCLLTDAEKVEMCRIVSDSDADYIKTSTGFSTGGATFEDVALMKEHCSERLKIKAAGGISGIEDAERFIALGADRLGTSRLVKLAVENK